MEEFDHLKIELKDVLLATDNFAPSRLIGRGGFGPVYKGELSRPDGLITVACKRLDRQHRQGNVEFLKEIMMLSRCKHKNLVSLLHFCLEGDERILVYEYAPRGSLDCHLSDPTLTWTQRLKICIGVAQALNYLHHPTETHQRIIHRDIKSSNILLDEEWSAKVSDFGLSKIAPANQPQTYLVSNAVGTHGYYDPLYGETGILSKESDVYSFGVVLFEVMCGTLCYEYGDGRLLGILVPKWKKCFEENRLDDIISYGLLNMEPDSLISFSTIAYQCLKTARKERPTMAKIVRQLKIALEQQELFEDIGKKMNFEEMRRIADHAASPLSNVTKSQLLMLFMKGLFVDDGKTAPEIKKQLFSKKNAQILWFSVNKKGQHHELISSTKCIPTGDGSFFEPDANLCSRFQYVFKSIATHELRLTVKTGFLSPDVTYIINLVYKRNYPHQYDLRMPLKYKLEEMKQYSTSCVAHVGKDGWLRTELFQFTSTKNQHYFDIQFLSDQKRHWPFDSYSTSIEGVEFCPVDLDENKVDVQPITYLDDIDWDNRLPHDYIYILGWHKIVDDLMARMDVYFYLRGGIYIPYSEQTYQWFSISKKSKKRLMIPARAILQEEKSSWNIRSQRKSWLWKSEPGLRFEKIAESCDNNNLAISFYIRSHLLSHNMMYACYLVFKLPENASKFEGIVVTSFKEPSRMHMHSPTERHIYLVTPPHTPIISLNADERPPKTRKIKGHPNLRKDGWMEIQIWEFLHNSSSYSDWMDGYLKSLKEWNFAGLLVQGIELRPAKFVSEHVISI